MNDASTGQRGAGKAVAFVILVLIAIIVGGYFWTQSRLHRETQAARATAQQQGEKLGRELAEDIARTLAGTLYGPVSQGKTASLEPIPANIVRGHRIAAVMVVDPQGKVIATTDLRYSNRTLPESEIQRLANLTGGVIAPTPPARDEVEADAPIQLGGERSGTVRVFVDISPFAGSAGQTSDGNGSSST